MSSKGCPHRWCVSPKRCPCCHHIPEGVMSQHAPKGMFQWQSCGIQRDASASGMSSKERPWCHHIPKRLSLLPACPPTVTTVTCAQRTHSWCVPRGVFPLPACPQNDVSATTMSRNRSPHCWCDHKGMSLLPPCPQMYAPTSLECPQRGAPTDVSALPPLRHVPKVMSPHLCCVPRGPHPSASIPCVPETGSPEGCPHFWHVPRLPYQLPVSPWQ